MTANPHSIGRYQVIDRLGQGGMGYLYLARDPAIERLVAIKLLRDNSDEVRERFAREARSAGRLRHVNIVTIFDVGEHDGQPFIAMEYIPGNTLADLIGRRAPLSIVRKLTLVEELCAGLAYAHNAGIIHRDIKPANLIVDADGVLKILDFGIARIGGSGMTLAGMLIGTINYMSPEQVTGQRIDHRSDIFAVGAVLYELLTYRQAFPGGIEEGLIPKIQTLNPEPISKFIADRDPDLERMIFRALAKDPADRYQDLGRMRLDIAAIRHRLSPVEETRTDLDLPEQATVLQASTPPPSMTPRRTDRAAIAKRRAEQIAAFLTAAREAMSAGRYEAAVASCEQAAVLNPDDGRILALLDEARQAFEQQQASGWVAEAREAVERGVWTAAQELVERALAIAPAFEDALQLKRRITQARYEAERLRERSAAIARSLERSRAAFDAGHLDEARDAATEALAIDPDHIEARELRQRARAALEDCRRRDELDERACQAIEDARAEFRAGQLEAALARLQAFEPHHDEVERALGELQHEAEAIWQRQREEEARRQREDEQRHRREEEARRKREEAAEGERRDEERRRKKEEEQRQREEARRKRAEDEGQRREAEEARRREQEDARRRDQEEEERRRREQEARDHQERVQREREQYVAARLEAAERALGTRRFSDALTCAREALAADADSARASDLLARIREDQRADKAAERAARLVTGEAERLLAAGDVDGALLKIEEAARAHPHVAAVDEFRQRAEQKRKEQKAAAKAHERLVDALITRVENLLDLGDLDMAARALQETRETHADSPRFQQCERRLAALQEAEATRRREAREAQELAPAPTAVDSAPPEPIDILDHEGVRADGERLSAPAAARLEETTATAVPQDSTATARISVASAPQVLASRLQVRLPRPLRERRVLVSIAAVLVLGIGLWVARLRSPETAPPAGQVTGVPATPPAATPPAALPSAAIAAPSMTLAPSTLSPAEIEQQLATYRSAARQQLARGEDRAALQSVSAGLQIRNNDPELTRILEALLGYARLQSDKAREGATAAGASGSASYQQAVSAESGATRLARDRKIDQAIRQYWRASTLFEQAALQGRAASGGRPAVTQPSGSQAMPSPTSSKPASAPATVGSPPTSVGRPPDEKIAAKPGSPAKPSLAAVSPEAAIADTLQRYAAAQATLNPAAVRQVWPTVDVDVLAETYKSLSALTVTIDNIKVLSVDDTTARVSCRFNQTTVAKSGARQSSSTVRTLVMKKAGDAWVIGSIATVVLR
ncbi:MAG: protein kinase [Acidobacteria bacterium]|nr:protein kinase [Acidobacteriota bacterium]